MKPWRLSFLLLFSSVAFPSHCDFLSLLGSFVEIERGMSATDLQRYVDSGAIDNPVKFAVSDLSELQREIFQTAFQEHMQLDPNLKKDAALSLLARLKSAEEKRAVASQDTRAILSPFILRSSIAQVESKDDLTSFLSSTGKWYATYTSYRRGQPDQAFYVDLNKGTHRLLAIRTLRHAGPAKFLELSDGRVFASYITRDEKGPLALEVRDLESGEIKYSIHRDEPIARKYRLLRMQDTMIAPKNPPIFQKEDGSIHLIAINYNKAFRISLDKREVTPIEFNGIHPEFLTSRDSRHLYSFGKRLEGKKGYFYVRDLSLDKDNVIFRERYDGRVRSAKLKETEDGNLFLAVSDITDNDSQKAHKLTVFDVLGGSKAEVDIPADHEAKDWIAGPGNSLWHYWTMAHKLSTQIDYIDAKTKSVSRLPFSYAIPGKVFSESLPNGRHLFVMSWPKAIGLFDLSEEHPVYGSLLPTKDSFLVFVGRMPDGRIVGLLSTSNEGTRVQDLATIQLYGPVPKEKK